MAGVLTWAFHGISRAVEVPKQPQQQHVQTMNEPEILDAEIVDEPIDVPYKVLSTTQTRYPLVKR
jgi:hypothetical protein